MKKICIALICMALIGTGCAGLGFRSAPTVVVILPTTDPNSTPVVPTETPTAEPPTATPEPTATQIPEDYGPNNFPGEVNPLTGLAVTDPTRLDRRPLAMKVQIFPRADRPPMNISLADIVYDYYQNNGMTRFHAIFYGNDAEQVGPIRSARMLDIALIRMYKTIFAFGGADKRVLNKLYASEFYDRLVVEGSSNCPPMCRLDQNFNNYLVVNTAEMGTFIEGKGIDNSRQNLDGMTFKLAAPADGQAGTKIYNRYSISAYSRWDYDSASARYLRYQDTREASDAAEEGYEALNDKVVGVQISAANVVVLLAPHKFLVKRGSTEIVDIELTSTGTAYAYRDGNVYQVIWNRTNTDSVLSLTYPDGTAFPFKPGNTWFEVAGKTSEITNPETGAWRFVNQFP
ncbi:MAG: DUF3048 domain-containing protein [Anaerolineales bacterium]|nr:DUF3048 domain-containing protein [Anaerolineales bacterium]